MRRELQERSKPLKPANLRVLVQIERYLTLSTLSPDEQAGCLEEICGKMEAAEAAGVSYRSFTGPNLKKYCDRLIARKQPLCSFRSFGKLLLQIHLLAVTGCFYGVCVLADRWIPDVLSKNMKAGGSSGKRRQGFSAGKLWTGMGVLLSAGLLWLCHVYLTCGAGLGNSPGVLVQMMVTAAAFQLGRLFV